MTYRTDSGRVATLVQTVELDGRKYHRLRFEEEDGKEICVDDATLSYGFKPCPAEEILLKCDCSELVIDTIWERRFLFGRHPLLVCPNCLVGFDERSHRIKLAQRLDPAPPKG